LRVEVLLASELSDQDRKEIWSILECNMKDLYAGSSFGWIPNDKQAELFHELSRFLLVRKTALLVASPLGPTETRCPISAYSMFRFEVEEKKDVVYCYEMQVLQELKRSGIGRCLMQQLVSIGKYWQMQKIMLTVFKSNSAARSFYKAIGFELDPTSPEYDDSDSEEDTVEEYDYEIMSMRIW
ncbi:hypothetical protein DAEQUDRAFT_663387, partial [Daedalea quercina L-15889]